MESVYKCRICDRMYHDKEVVIDLSSEEAKREQIAPKILSALSIIITDHDPTPKYICRICYGQVEVNFRFATTCRKNNAKYIENLTNSPSNDVVRAEYNKFMRIPVQALFNKYQFDAKGLYDAVTRYLNDNNEDLTSNRHFKNFDQYFGLDNHNSITNQFDIENKDPVSNGIPESSLVTVVNAPCTNEPNIDTYNVDNIHNSGIDLNNRTFTNIPILNTNGLNLTNNTGVCRNIQLNANFSILANSLRQTISPGSDIIRIIPNVGKNNVNNRISINNINQSSTNLPIVCKNNVMKTSKFCVLSKQPRLLINSRIVGTNIVQNFGPGTRINQFNVNSSAIVQSTVNNHNSVQSNEDKEITVISDDEVICLDDDNNHNDDDNNRNNDSNNNNNGNNSQEFNHHLSQWLNVNNHTKIIRNTNNNANTHFFKTYQRKHKNKGKKTISFKRKLISLYNNEPSTSITHSSNIPTEEMTVTPDMPLSTSDAGSSINQEEDLYFDVPLPEHNESTESTLVESETEPSRILPEIGFHFLFSSDEIVDLTTKEDNSPEKKIIIRKKKSPKPKKALASKKQSRKAFIAQLNPKATSQLLRPSTSSNIEKKQPQDDSIDQPNPKATSELQKSSTSSKIEKKQPRKASIPQLNKSQLLRPSTSSNIEKKESRKASIAQLSKARSQLLRSSTSSTIENSDTSLTKPRPKRASAIASTAENKNTGLWKLGKHAEGYWTADAERISLQLYRCPICDVLLYSPESRRRHESLKHSSLLKSIHKPVDIVTASGNVVSTEQLDLFNYLQLFLISENKTKAVNQLAKRTHLLQAFKILKRKTVGSFNCDCCPYATNLMFVLWAHMTSYHLDCAEKKSCLFCFLCSRTLTKRTTMLKHLDGCVIKQNGLTINNSCNQITCVHCGDSFDSLIQLDDHTWRHHK